MVQGFEFLLKTPDLKPCGKAKFGKQNKHNYICRKILYHFIYHKISITMAYKISDIEGIGPVLSEKLEAAGVKTVEQLLERGATPKGRKELEESTGISHSKILTFVNHADLFRIKGISSQYSELLEAAGVDTVKELRNRNAANLHAKMIEVNNEKQLVRQVPALSQVESFIEQAKELPPVVTY